MAHQTRNGPRGLVLGLALGLALAWGVGSAQPEGAGQPAPSPVEQELGLIRAGLFREGSELPADPGKSIEQMLEDQGRAIERLSAQLSAFDTRQLDVIQQRLADFDRTVAALDTSGISRLDSEVEAMRRSVDELVRDVDQLERDQITDIQRTLDDMERAADQPGGRPVDSVQGELRDLRFAIQRVERTLEAIERKIR